DRRARRALQVAVHVEPLEEPARAALRFELLTSHEQVVGALPLPGATRGRVGRHGTPEAGITFEQLANGRSLAVPGRAGDDEQDAQSQPRTIFGWQSSPSACLRPGR